MRHYCRSMYWRPAYAHGCSSRNTHYETRSHRGAQFGVRRPLRYLGYQLDLSENQMRRMGSVLNAIKNEREQLALDEKRTLSAVADLLTEGVPTLEELNDALALRNTSSEKLQGEIAQALAQIADMLDEDQREQFVGLLVNGSIAF